MPYKSLAQIAFHPILCVGGQIDPMQVMVDAILVMNDGLDRKRQRNRHALEI